MFQHFLFSCFFALFITFSLEGAHPLFTLKENFQKAQVGDYIVAIQNKNYTLLQVLEKTDDSIRIEEVSVPLNKFDSRTSWRTWLEQGAPGHTNRILSTIDLKTGLIQQSYSVTQKAWLEISKGNQLLSTLLNLPLFPIQDQDRKRIGQATSDGSRDRRSIWQPKMIVNGHTIPNVLFSAWKTRWPSDDSPLANRWVTVYLPQNHETYPAYFPYWLEVHGGSGSKVSIRIVDSGRKPKN